MNLWTVKAHELHAAQARQLAELARTAQPDQTLDRSSSATAAGDALKLRGIPVVGARGIGGAIPGTRPDLAASR